MLKQIMLVSILSCFSRRKKYIFFKTNSEHRRSRNNIYKKKKKLAVKTRVQSRIRFSSETQDWRSYVLKF